MMTCSHVLKSISLSIESEVLKQCIVREHYVAKSTSGGGLVCRTIGARAPREC